MVAATPASVRLRRTWPQRLLITFNCLLIVGCLSAAGGVGYFYYRFGTLPRLTFGDGVLSGDSDPGGAQNYLLVGSDTRAGQDAESFGTVGGARADTMILVRIDPRAERAAMVSFPRDLFIPIYSAEGLEGGRDRINTAFANGPDQLVMTITKNFGIPIHHYVQVNFAGFRDLVDAVGGVELYLAGAVRDREPGTGRNVAGLDVPESGCVTLGGGQALAYVRSRNFEQFVDGRWQRDPSGDHGRIQRQQDFIRRAVRAALSEGLTNPTKLNQLLDVADDNIVVDSKLDGRDVVNIGKRFRSLTPDTLDQRSLVVSDFRTSAGAAVLRLVDGPDNEETFDIFRGIEAGPEDVTPASVRLRVLNGTGRSREAGGARDGLGVAGFNVVGVGDGSFGTDLTTIRYAAGQEAKAALLAAYLVSPGAHFVLDPALTVDIVLTTGMDYEGILAEPRPVEAVPPPAAEEPPPPADEAPEAEAEPDPAEDC
ncbi:MAG TPA: LCP family protein [Acidimicrobiales bacterium]|nr:LCP family protein [Acidimicrobiales bacterium]